MTNLIIVGTESQSQLYVENYIAENNFTPYEVERFFEKIKIEDSRNIKKALFLKVKKQKLFVFFSGLTIEAQNALLKSIEESDENIHFIFCIQKEDELLPTIRSRCSITNLSNNSEIDRSLCDLVEKIANEKDNSWADVDLLISSVSELDMEILLPNLRFLLLDAVEKKKKVANYYIFCRRFLGLLPLSQNNNVNQKVILEKVFV